MGSAMVSRLLHSGVHVAVWNRSPEKAIALEEKGAERLHALVDAVRCDVVFSMVADDDALDALHHSGSGLLSGAKENRNIRAWIDGSTVSVDAARRAAEAAHQQGVSFASAPISGNPAVVESGNAIFAVSGDEVAVDLGLALGLAIGRAAYRVGTSTEANVIKLCTNALLAVTMQSLAEIVVLADRAKVSRTTLMSFINDSAIGSPFTKYKTNNMVSLDFTPMFTPFGQRKDIRLALDVAHELEVPMPVLNTTEVAFSRLVSGGLGEGRDFSALVLEVARDAGHTLEAE